MENPHHPQKKFEGRSVFAELFWIRLKFRKLLTFHLQKPMTRIDAFLEHVEHKFFSQALALHGWNCNFHRGKGITCPLRLPRKKGRTCVRPFVNCFCQFELNPERDL